MLKNDYLGRMKPYQNDFSDSLNTGFAAHFIRLNASNFVKPNTVVRHNTIIKRIRRLINYENEVF